MIIMLTYIIEEYMSDMLSEHVTFRVWSSIAAIWCYNWILYF